MKVLLVSALPPPEGGIATWTERYLEYCYDHCIDTTMVNIALSGDRGQKINSSINIKDEVVRTLRVLKKMIGCVNCDSISVTHINTSCGAFGIFRDLLCIKVAYKKTPIVLHFHCNIENRVYGKIRLWVLKRMITMADRVLVLNSTSKQFISKISEKIPIVLPNFINSNYLVEKHQIRSIIKEIIFVGHVQMTKGCKEILEAASQLPGIHFTLIGPIADEIAKLPCPENVSMIGVLSHDEVKNYLIDADLYLFPSYTEGFSQSLTEAMATGLPSVATEVGANKDMLEDKGGVIIPVKNTEAIIKAIRALSSSTDRKKMSEWAINKVKKCYLTEQVMNRLINIYSEVENEH